jgi:hypothetical protein
MNQNQLKYTDPSGINVVDADGNLKWLQTPFSACCIMPCKEIKDNSLVYIEATAINNLGELVYIINGLPYPHTHFVVDSSY